MPLQSVPPRPPSDRSQLPDVSTVRLAPAKGAAVPVFFLPNSTAVQPRANLTGQRAGAAPPARPLSGRVAAVPAPRPGDPVGAAAARGINTLNDLINRIESTRPVGLQDKPLPRGSYRRVARR